MELGGQEEDEEALKGITTPVCRWPDNLDTWLDSFACPDSIRGGECSCLEFRPEHSFELLVAF